MAKRPATIFLQLALRRATCGVGSPPTFFQRRTAVQPIPPLRDYLGSTRWALAAGLSLRAYIPERRTLRITILIHERDGEAVRTALIAFFREPT